MRNLLLAAIAVVLLLTLIPHRAHACGRGGSSGYGGLVTIALVTLGTDAVFSLYDLSTIADSRPSMAYGVVELLISAPQVALGVSLAKNGTAVWYPIWMGLLSAHGIWTIAASAHGFTSSGPGGSEAPGNDLRCTVSIAPTYVPLGQLAQPGMGLVGRF